MSGAFFASIKIDLAARKSWCESNDPEFAAKAADVVGLYVDPPAKAIVLCVDEKPSIQALERAQGYLKLPNGRALTGQSHDYKRHGTTTLFAALEVATGKVIASHSNRRRRVEFLGFMNSVVAAFPDRELHVILDNLNTHKKNERWLKKHPKVHFHFTPTRASWLNQVETWFSILQGQSLSGASFTAVAQLQEHIDADGSEAEPAEFPRRDGDARDSILTDCARSPLEFFRAGVVFEGKRQKFRHGHHIGLSIGQRPATRGFLPQLLDFVLHLPPSLRAPICQQMPNAGSGQSFHVDSMVRKVLSSTLFT